MEKKRYLLLFETKPPFAELDALFRECLEYEPVLSTSYVFTVDKGKYGNSFHERVAKLFPRYTYVLCPIEESMYRRYETPFIKTGLILDQ